MYNNNTNQMKELALCRYPNCNRYFKIPIRLPCENTICKEHLDEAFAKDRRFFCKLCLTEHDLSYDDFKFNIEKLELMSLNLHLDEKQRKVKELMDKFQSIVDEMFAVTHDPYNYLYRHVSKLKNDVNEHREELKTQIDQISEDMINKLDAYEKICKSRISIDSDRSLEKTKDDVLKLNETIVNMRELMRIPNLNEKKLVTIHKDIENSILLSNEKLDILKNKILDNKTLSFEKSDFVFDENLFGKLIMSDMLACIDTLVNDQSYCVEIINDYLLASGSGDDKINIWNYHNRRILKTLSGHSGFITCLKLLPRDQIASCSFDKTIKIWNLDTFECVETLRGHTQGVSCCAYSDTSNYLITGSYDTTIKIWSMDDFKCIKTLKGHSFVVFNLLFNPKNNSIISCSADKTIKIWYINKKYESITLKGHQNMVTSLALNKSGNHLFSGSYDGTIKVWEIDGTNKGECVRTLQFDGSKIQTILLLSNNLMIIGNQSFNNEPNLRILSLNDAKYRSIRGHSATINDLKKLPNGNIVSCADDNLLKIWGY